MFLIFASLYVDKHITFFKFPLDEFMKKLLFFLLFPVDSLIFSMIHSDLNILKCLAAIGQVGRTIVILLSYQIIEKNIAMGA